MTNSSHCLRSFVGRTGFVVAVLFALAIPEEAAAQRWLATAQLEVPLEEDEPASTLLDTLTQVLSRTDSLRVTRSPSKEEGRPLETLIDRLVEEEGLAPGSANYVRIDYQFTVDERGYKEKIEAVHFLYRSGPDQETVPLLYVEADQPWFRRVLMKQAAPHLVNCGTPPFFEDELLFARMQEHAKILEINGNNVREGFERKKRQLIQKITRLTYESM